MNSPRSFLCLYALLHVYGGLAASSDMQSLSPSAVPPELSGAASNGVRYHEDIDRNRERKLRDIERRLNALEAQGMQLQVQPEDRQRPAISFEHEIRGRIRKPRCSFDRIEGTLSDEQSRIVALFKGYAAESDFSEFGPLLLHGPPGTGKTLFAKALANEGKMPFCRLSAGSLSAGYAGDGVLRIQALRSCASEYPKLVVLIDEIDALRSREALGNGSAAANMVNTGMELWQAMDDVDSHKGLLFVAATNFPTRLDEAMKRRFCLKVAFDFPDNERTHMAVQHHLGVRAVAESLAWPYQSWSHRFLRFMFPGGLRSKVSYSDTRLLVLYAKHAARLDKSETIEQRHVDKAWKQLLERKKSDSELSEDEKERRKAQRLSMLRIAISLGGIWISYYTSNKSMALQREQFDKSFDLQACMYDLQTDEARENDRSRKVTMAYQEAGLRVQTEQNVFSRMQRR